MAMRATGGKVVTGWLHHHLRQTARAPYNCAYDRITHVTHTATLTECSNVWSAHYPRQQCRHGDTYNMVPRSQAHAHMQRVSAVSVARNIAVGGGVTVCTVVCGGSRRFTAVHGVSRRIHGVSRFVHGSVPANIRWKVGRQGCRLRVSGATFVHGGSRGFTAHPRSFTVCSRVGPGHILVVKLGNTYATPAVQHPQVFTAVHGVSRRIHGVSRFVHG